MKAVVKMRYMGVPTGWAPAGKVAYFCTLCRHHSLGDSGELPDCPVCNAPEPDLHKWDRRWLKMAKEIAQFSKDPSTQTGAVIIGPDKDVISIGYNGFARGVEDSNERLDDRDTKYSLVVHCEVNAVVFGDRARLRGATLYTWPFMSCSNCAGVVIQAGIKRCVAPPTEVDKAARWEKSMRLARVQFDEAGVELVILPDA